MSYELRAVIAGDDVLRGVVRELPAARSAPLGAGSVAAAGDERPPRRRRRRHDTPAGFRWLPAGFDARLVAWSAAGPVAFVEAEYFGGVGEQRTAVWAGGALVLGPLAVGEGERLPVGGSPISQALRRLGAVARDGGDEFSAVGLGRHRRSGRWIS
ncbi:hypothetical protein ACIHAR_33235 [Streptomyces sp. NPDC052016]|uniref:hypothetical protein n=1 Tax=Streptomyces sp. NPDC052016 TaxID=3365680 RepID=UPI0037D22EC4